MSKKQLLALKRGILEGLVYSAKFITTNSDDFSNARISIWTPKSVCAVYLQVEYRGLVPM